MRRKVDGYAGIQKHTEFRHTVYSLAAGSPVAGVNLPESDIETATGVLVDGVGVTAGLVLHDALAVSLCK